MSKSRVLKFFFSEFKYFLDIVRKRSAIFLIPEELKDSGGTIQLTSSTPVRLPQKTFAWMLLLYFGKL